jgi:ABC-type nitrate/sulfonate/bicarbonate transport system substrate-binding protein
MRNSIARRSLLKKALTGLGCTAVMLLSPLSVQIAQAAELEKEELKLGFIKLTDMAPLAIAYEKGFFEDEGLYVTLEDDRLPNVSAVRAVKAFITGLQIGPNGLICFGSPAQTWPQPVNDASPSTCRTR